MDETRTTTAQFADDVKKLEQRLLADQIVSEDIKALAGAVRVLACLAVDMDAAIDHLMSRPPTKNITVNYGK